jgi:predicted flap endonuclease-1-like 5' DNA nuclease
MPLDLQSLSTDTLLYMLMHSGIFVAIMGAVFFLIGLIFGHSTWGRFKTQSRMLAREIEQQRHEIATLKRKVGDHSVKPGSVSLATDSITMPSAGSEPSTSDIPPPVLSPVEHQPPPPPTPALPAEIINDSLAPAEPPTASLSAKIKAPKAKTTIKAKPAEPKITIESIPAPIEPPPTLPERPAAPSPLAAIIAPHAAPALPKPEKPAPETLATAVESLDIIPALPELPSSTAPTEIKPEHDAKLGLVYKTPPPEHDDLTALKGIAKVLEQRLHEFGIYTYDQIAAWTEDQIKEFSSRLAFKDRIHREKWVEQAKKLLSGKTPHT